MPNGIPTLPARNSFTTLARQRLGLPVVPGDLVFLERAELLRQAPFFNCGSAQPYPPFEM